MAAFEEGADTAKRREIDSGWRRVEHGEGGRVRRDGGEGE